MTTGELMTAEHAREWRDNGVDGNREEIARLCDTIIALHELLGAAARGELPRCEGWRADDDHATLATRATEGRPPLCDECFGRRRANGPDDDAWLDLPHAAALRAAMAAKGGAT
jgi:hypothetical protein